MPDDPTTDVDPAADPATDAVDPAADPAAPWTPPSKEEWEKVQNSLRKANRQAQTAREAGDQKTAAQETEFQKALREQNELNDARVVRAEAKAALVAAKVKADRVAALLKVAGTDGLKIDKHGEVDGLDDWVELQKTEFPEFFDGRVVRQTGNVGAGDKPTPKQPLSYAQQLMKNAGL